MTSDTTMTVPEALTLDVTAWLNAPDVDLADLRGRVVMIETFQMLCPGCVSYGLPQAQRVHRTYPRDEVVVLGLHTVFEHHDVMGADALAAFLSEYGIDFPVGIDRHDGDDIPVTMARYGLRGTPSTLLLDRAGRLRHSSFGAVEDLVLGNHLGRLLAEPAPASDPAGASPTVQPRSTDGAVCAPGVGCDPAASDVPGPPSP